MGDPGVNVRENGAAAAEYEEDSWVIAPLPSFRIPPELPILTVLSVSSHPSLPVRLGPGGWLL